MVNTTARSDGWFLLILPDIEDNTGDGDQGAAIGCSLVAFISMVVTAIPVVVLMAVLLADHYTGMFGDQ